jgi:type I restriction enzyme S subunit
MKKDIENGLPKYWVITKLGEVIKWGSGGTPSRKIKKYFTGDIP